MLIARELDGRFRTTATRVSTVRPSAKISIFDPASRCRSFPADDRRQALSGADPDHPPVRSARATLLNNRGFPSRDFCETISAMIEMAISAAFRLDLQTNGRENFVERLPCPPAVQ